MTATPEIFASDVECRCDCVNCVTANHAGCYYNPHCPLYRIVEGTAEEVDGEV